MAHSVANPVSLFVSTSNRATSFGEHGDDDTLPPALPLVLVLAGIRVTCTRAELNAGVNAYSMDVDVDVDVDVDADDDVVRSERSSPDCSSRRWKLSNRQTYDNAAYLVDMVFASTKVPSSDFTQESHGRTSPSSWDRARC